MYESENAMQRAYDGPSVGGGELKRITIRKELEIEVNHLEKTLATKRELLQLLTDNPVIEKFMNLSRGIL